VLALLAMLVEKAKGVTNLASSPNDSHSLAGE
jgi:hypothetical protein